MTFRSETCSIGDHDLCQHTECFCDCHNMKPGPVILELDKMPVGAGLPPISLGEVVSAETLDLDNPFDVLRKALAEHEDINSIELTDAQLESLWKFIRTQYISYEDEHLIEAIAIITRAKDELDSRASKSA